LEPLTTPGLVGESPARGMRTWVILGMKTNLRREECSDQPGFTGRFKGRGAPLLQFLLVFFLHVMF
jgi:hypothetical protein